MKRMALLAGLMLTGCAGLGGSNVAVPPAEFDHVPAGAPIPIEEMGFFEARSACAQFPSISDPRDFGGACVLFFADKAHDKIVPIRIIVAKAGVEGFSQEDHDRAIRAEYGKINQKAAGDAQWYRTDGAHGWRFRP